MSNFSVRSNVCICACVCVVICLSFILFTNEYLTLGITLRNTIYNGLFEYSTATASFFYRNTIFLIFRTNRSINSTHSRIWFWRLLFWFTWLRKFWFLCFNEQTNENTKKWNENQAKSNSGGTNKWHTVGWYIWPALCSFVVPKLT